MNQPDLASGRLDAVVVGAAAMDMMVQVDRLPEKDGIVLAKQAGMQPGGSGANVAVAIAKLGFKAGFVGRLSQDENGQTLLHAFENEGVDVAACQMRPDLPTAMCFIAVDASGNRSMVALGGAGSIETAGELDRDYLTRARLLYLTDVNPIVVHTIRELTRAQGSPIVFNPGGIASARGLDNLFALLSEVDIILLSRSEAHNLLPAYLPEQVPDLLCAQGARNVIVTMGEKGLAYANPQQSKIFPAFPSLQVVDTTGAGDAFAAGLVAGILMGKSIEESVNYGRATASLKIGHAGARGGLPSMQRVKNLLASASVE